MICPQCSASIHNSHTECPECNAHLGFPNVRQAEEQSAQDALRSRYKDACDYLSANSRLPIGLEFEQAVTSNSTPVICRRPSMVGQILDRGEELFLTYYQQLETGKRRPADNEFDDARQGIDASFFPYYFQKINFAALSLDGIGPSSYGHCHFAIRPSAISHRTTVFEENTLVFVEKHNVRAGSRAPAGYLSTWSDRGMLAVAKLKERLESTTNSADFCSIVLENCGRTDTDEFLECHIYGKLTITNIKSATVTSSGSPEERVFAKRAIRKLKASQVEVVERK